jgi:hypothetical protein
MGVYQSGNVVLVDETFYVETIPGDFSTAVPTDPTTVTFSVRDPSNVVVAYIWGVDGEVANPSVGRYVLTLAAATEAGDWFYRCAGTGTVQAASEGGFTISASSVLVPTTTEPRMGPCQAWCDEQDVALFGDTGVGSDWSQLEGVCVAASEILYELSGRQYGGVCVPETVRPCATGCGCWNNWLPSPPLSPGAPQVSVGWGWWGGGFGWGWGTEGSSEVCGCQPLSTVALSGYPVVEVTEVKIDGVVLATTEYRLDDWRYLVRLADSNGDPQYWPGCQRLDLEDTESGTWAVTYRAGQVPPLIGTQAAAQLAFQLWRAMNGSECLLPAGVTTIQRQGITVQRAPFTAWGIKNGSWATGLSLVDAFLSAYNPAGLSRPSAVWSPDLPQFARHLG